MASETYLNIVPVLGTYVERTDLVPEVQSGHTQPNLLLHGFLQIFESQADLTKYFIIDVISSAGIYLRITPNTGLSAFEIKEDGSVAINGVPENLGLTIHQKGTGQTNGLGLIDVTLDGWEIYLGPGGNLEFWKGFLPVLGKVKMSLGINGRLKLGDDLTGTPDARLQSFRIPSFPTMGCSGISRRIISIC